MIREYRAVQSGDRWDVVNIRTGEIYNSYHDEDTAEFMAEEAFCDDEVMIRHEEENK